jgi:hypothetical protein
VDDMCRGVHPVLHKRHELIKELLIHRDCQEFRRSVRQAM